MKKGFIIIAAAFLLGCGGANDGDARTDTTTMPADRGMMDNLTLDSNSNTGTYPTNVPADSGRRTTTGTSPDSRSTTPGNDSARRR